VAKSKRTTYRKKQRQPKVIRVGGRRSAGKVIQAYKLLPRSERQTGRSM
jgi:hypothetical protein